MVQRQAVDLVHHEVVGRQAANNIHVVPSSIQRLDGIRISLFWVENPYTPVHASVHKIYVKQTININTVTRFKVHKK